MSSLAEDKRVFCRETRMGQCWGGLHYKAGAGHRLEGVFPLNIPKPSSSFTPSYFPPFSRPQDSNCKVRSYKGVAPRKLVLLPALVLPGCVTLSKSLALSGVTPDPQLVSVSYSSIWQHDPSNQSHEYCEDTMRGWMGKYSVLEKCFPVLSPLPSDLIKVPSCPFFDFGLDGPVIITQQTVLNILCLSNVSHSSLRLPILQDPSSRKSSLTFQPS